MGLDVIVSDPPSMAAFELAAQETFGKGKMKPALENQWIAHRLIELEVQRHLREAQIKERSWESREGIHRSRSRQ